jgi:hypothetical protein
MGWLMIDALDRFQTTVWNYKTPNPERMIAAIIETVTKDGTIRNMAKKKIVDAVTALDGRLEEEMQQSGPPMNRQGIWDQYLSVGEMKWALWASQWLAYGAVYFSYENFLRTTVGIARRNPAYRAGRIQQMKDDFKVVFGQPLANACFDGPVDIARKVRNCIAHNGGEESAELRRSIHGIRVEAGYLQIFPEDVRDLYGVLKARALDVADAAQSIPAFRLTP